MHLGNGKKGTCSPARTPRSVLTVRVTISSVVCCPFPFCTYSCIQHNHCRGNVSSTHYGLVRTVPIADSVDNLEKVFGSLAVLEQPSCAAHVLLVDTASWKTSVLCPYRT